MAFLDIFIDWRWNITGTISAIVIVNILLAIGYMYMTRKFSYWQRRMIPYERPTIFVGSMGPVFRGNAQIGKYLGKLYSKYQDQPYFGIYIWDKPYLVLRDPKIIKRILVADFHNFSDRIFACDVKAHRICGNSVFLLRNPQWRAVRTQLTSIFTSSKLHLMLPIMHSVGEQLHQYLTRISSNSDDDSPIDAKDISSRFMTDVTAESFFGFKTASFLQKDTENMFRRVAHKMFDFKEPRVCLSAFAYFFLPWLVSWMRLSFLDFESVQFLSKIFNKTLLERKINGHRRNDFVDLLLGLKNSQFDEDLMVSQALTFFIAGFESTSNVVSFALYELCLHQDLQDKLRDEIHQFLNTNSSSTTFTYEELQSLKYMDMVLAETMRRYPFAPFLNRKCKQDYLIPETGFVIEAGSEIIIPTDGLHYDPKYYPEPDQFRPERFAETQRFTSVTYMPFGNGPRYCIGDRFGVLAAKVGLVYMLRDFKVEKCEATPVPLVLNPRSPFVKCDGGLLMKLTKIIK